MSAAPAKPVPSGGAQASQAARILLPALVLAAGLVLWELVVRINDIQPYVLPAPWLVLKTMAADWDILFQSLLVTLLTTLEGFVCAAVGAVVLSLLGAVVAEIAAGSAGAGSGLAYRIAESGYRLNIPRMFAALLLLSAAGIVIYGLLALVSHLVLRRWHESALGKEN